MKEDVNNIIWTGTLTNERVLQSLIGGEKGCLLTVVRQGNGRRSG